MPKIGNFEKNMSSFWQFFDIQMAIFRRVRSQHLSPLRKTDNNSNGHLSLVKAVGSTQSCRFKCTK